MNGEEFEIKLKFFIKDIVLCFILKKQTGKIFGIF